ncbi:UNVERIFIED_CONTAM: hypothetical protein GTU68_048729 [Idotea baltica]|nr:hypothetical protein [Idotea baltica]
MAYLISFYWPSVWLSLVLKDGKISKIFLYLKLDWLRQYRPFKSGIPRHDCESYLPTQICEIESAFQSWISSLVILY